MNPMPENQSHRTPGTHEQQSIWEIPVNYIWKTVKSFEFIGEDFTPDPAIEIPFTTFEGWLKCHRPHFSNDIGAAALQAAFPRFLTRERMSDRELEGYKRMAEQTAKGVLHYSSFFWTGRPSRRYAGDYLDKFTLPRGCYYTVCQDESGDDGQTLANEMMAYRDLEKSGECHALDLYDPEYARFAGASETKQEIAIIFCSRPHLYNPFLSTLSTLSGKPLSGYSVETVSVTVPYQVERQVIDRVVDLRLPNTRKWFADTFAEGDGCVLLKTLISQKPVDIHFGLMLPKLMDAATGGNSVTTAIGLWMRLYGVNALIFPSARSDVRVSLRNNQLCAFWGWNLVDYREAPPPPRTFQRSIDFSDWEQAGSMASIGEAPPGDEYAGSLRVDGIIERREENFKKQVEHFYDRHFIIHPPGYSDMGPVDLDFIRTRFDGGALATTTGVTSQDEHLPAFNHGNIEDLFTFPTIKSEAEPPSISVKPPPADLTERHHEWKPSGKWFQERCIEGLEFEIKCPICSWTSSYFARDEYPPEECGHCRYPQGKGAANT